MMPVACQVIVLMLCVEVRSYLGSRAPLYTDLDRKKMPLESVIKKESASAGSRRRGLKRTTN